MYRAFLTSVGTVTTESVAADYAAQAGEVMFDGPPTQAELDAAFPVALKTRLKGLAAAHRYDLETGGYTLSGKLIDTDRDTQDRLTQVNLLMQNDPTITEIAWKASTGFVTTPVADLHAAAIAVGRFVQACYAAESAIGALIDDSTIATEEAIAGWNGWPAAES
jgi:hypothetical protein